MTIEFKVPEFPESAGELVLKVWHKQPGDFVRVGETVAEIEADQAVVMVSASADGELLSHNKAVGEKTSSGEVIGAMVEQSVPETLADSSAESGQVQRSSAVGEILAPNYPESVDDGTVLTWHKAVGEHVSRDELLVEIETDKVVMEVVATADGVLTEIIKGEGDVAVGQDLLGRFSVEEGELAVTSSDDSAIEIKAPAFPESVDAGTISAWHKQPGDAVKRDEQLVDIETDKVVLEVVAPADGVLAEIRSNVGDEVAGGAVVGLLAAGEVSSSASAVAVPPASDNDRVAPAARVLLAENNLSASQVKGSGKGGLITKEDILNHLSAKPVTPVSSEASAQQPVAPLQPSASGRIEQRVPMTRMRARIAERLLGATNETAMLTTFNEVNMAPVMALRNQYKALFEKSHDGTRLGFMGFFVKAAAEALKRFPAVNASIDGDDIVYHGYQDIGVAVATEKGLVVPVLRDTDDMSIATVESTIRDFGVRARDGKLGIEEMQGGTFTITNGGVFGSLMSTPILNPPQAAIMGMHKIQDRPMAVDGEVVILPMMYLALSYDHRLIDGKDAVQFLVTIKELLEDPARILLEI